MHVLGLLLVIDLFSITSAGTTEIQFRYSQNLTLRFILDTMTFAR